MPRKNFLCSPLHPYHIVGRAHNKGNFPIPPEEAWKIFCTELNFANCVYDMRIHSFVMMSNHIHLIASFPEANYSVAMQHFMGQTSRAINDQAGQINQLWGKRSFRSQLSSYHYFLNAYKYVYQNPIRAGICEKVEDYKFSSINRLLGGEHLPFPLVEDTLLFADDTVKGALSWLNTKMTPENAAVMKAGLRRSIFKLPYQKYGHHPLETSLI